MRPRNFELRNDIDAEIGANTQPETFDVGTFDRILMMQLQLDIVVVIMLIRCIG